MKKILLTLLMLMMVVGLFANNEDAGTTTVTTSNDTVLITAKVDPLNKAWFAESKESYNTKIDTIEMNPKSLTADSKTTVYVVGETNKQDGFTLTVYGTALTLVTDTDTPEFDKNDNHIAITVKENGNVSNSKTFSLAATGKEASTTGEGLTVIVVSASTTEGKRHAGKTLDITIAEGDEGKNKLTSVASGDYWAYLTLEYTTNA